MKMYIVGIFDRKAQMFVNVYPTPNIGVAAREFTETINRQGDSNVYKWPLDHELYELAHLDTETGKIVYHSNEEGDYEKKLILSGEAAKQLNS